MFGKKRKKLDRKMRRRIRKTSAVMLLISAIVVAAIPVPEAAAAAGDTITYADEPKADTKTYSVTAADDKIIPKLSDDTKVYKSEGGKFNFAYINERSVAVLLNVKCGSDSANVVIPETVNAYTQIVMTQPTDRSYAAANQYGSPLYYRELRTVTVTRTTNDTYESGESAPLDNDTFAWGGWRREEGTFEPEGVSSAAKSSLDREYDKETKIYKETFHYVEYRFKPCVLGDEDKWYPGEDEAKVPRYLYYQEKNDTGFNRDNLIFYDLPALPDGTDEKDIVPPEDFVKYISNTENSKKKIFDRPGNGSSDKDDDWLMDAPVVYISDQRAGYVKKDNGETVLELTGIPTNNEEKPFFYMDGVDYGGMIESVTFPKNLVAIADYSFYGCSALGSVAFKGMGEGTKPNEKSAIAEIGQYAFGNCTSLKTFDFPNGGTSVKVLANSVFEGCKSLREIKVPLSILTIYDSAFKNCSGGPDSNYPGLTVVDFSQAVGLTEFGSNIFEGCKKLESLVMPVNLAKMGQSNFAGCNALTEIVFPDPGMVINGSNGISLSNFWGCSALKFIDVESKDLTFAYKDSSDNYYGYDTGNGQKISVIQKFLADVDKDFYFKGYDKADIHKMTSDEAIVIWLKDSDIERFEKIIREYDDSGKINVTYTYRADPVTEDVEIRIDGTPEIVEIEESIAGVKVRKIGKLLDKTGNPNTKLEAIKIPKFIVEIGDGAFEDCSNLKKVYFDKDCEIAYDPENGISGFGENAFKTQRASAGAISEGAWLTFYGDISLDSGAFRYAMDPDNYFNKVERVSDRAFIDFCSDPEDGKNVHVKLNNYGSVENPDYRREVWKVPTTDVAKSSGSKPNGKKDDYYWTLREALLETEPGYTTDNVDDKINELIENYEVSGNDPSFEDDKPMKVFMSAYEITLPSGIQSIAEGLFSEADEEKTTDKDTLNKLTNSPIGIPAKKTDSGGGIFKANTSVRKIIMEDVEELEPYTFYGCENLEWVEMYPSCKEDGESIGDYAFAHCPDLTTVKLPNSTVTMGKRPFAGNMKLKSVEFVGEDGSARSTSGSSFSCENQIIYGLKNGAKDSIIQCLEGRGTTRQEYNDGLDTVGEDELAGVQSIREEAFMNCTGIETVNFSRAAIESIPKLCFNNATKLESVIIPMSCRTVYNYAFKDTALKILDAEGYTTPTYFDYAFYNTDDTGHVKNGVKVITAKDSTTYNKYLQYGDQGLGYGWRWDAKAMTCVTIFVDEDGNEVARHEDAEGREIKEPTEEELEKYFAEFPESRFVGMAVTSWKPRYTTATEALKTVEVVFDDTVHVTFYDDGLNVIHEEDVVKGGTIKREPKNVPSIQYPGKTCNMWQSTPAGISPSDTITEDGVIFMAYYSPSAVPGGPEDTDPNACTIRLYGVYAEYLKGWDIVKTPGSNVVINKETELPKTYYDEKTETTYRIKSWKPLKDTANYTIDTPMNEAGLREFKVDEFEIVSGSGNPNNPNNPNGGNNGTNGNGSGTSGNNTNQTLYTLTVVNGSGSGSYTADTQVTVAAYTPNTGYEFYSWTSSESDTNFTSKTLAATSFKMPAKNLTVTANYRTKAETGNSITSKRTPGTVTSAPSSNTGSTSGGSSSTGNRNNGSNSGSSVQVSRPGISNTDVASATVNGSTDNFVVRVTEDGSATMAVAEALRNEYGSLDNIRYFAMDISLYDESGTKKITDTSGLSVTMTLPIPDELRQYAGNNKVGAVTNGNRLEKLTPRFTTVNGVPCVTFTATHFSPYTIYVDTANLSAGGYDATPKTGDAIHPKWFLAVGLALFSAVLFLKKDKKVSHITA